MGIGENISIAAIDNTGTKTVFLSSTRRCRLVGATPCLYFDNGWTDPLGGSGNSMRVCVQRFVFFM
jgi:hypothetical protein